MTMLRAAMPLLARIVAAVALLLSSPAMASPQCLTKAEARERYNSKHLYWHTDERCWDDHRHNDRDWPLAKPAQPPAIDPQPISRTPGLWPDPPTEIGFAWRWPDASPVRSPLLWWRELMEFNR